MQDCKWKEKDPLFHLGKNGRPYLKFFRTPAKQVQGVEFKSHSEKKIYKNTNVFHF
jgi:hypothetical protein